MYFLTTSILSSLPRLIRISSSIILITFFLTSLLPIIGYIFIATFAASSGQDEGLKSDLSSNQVRPIIVNESNLKVEIVSKLNFEFEEGSQFFSPVSSMAFLDANNILVLDKNNGKIYRILNGIMLEDVLLDVNVANKIERGMLGIAISGKEGVQTSNTTTTMTTRTTSNQNENENDSSVTYVFLYFTESENEDGNDNCPNTNTCKEGNEPVGNRLYRYELINNKLVNPKVLLDLPATPGPSHNGGAIVIGPDNHLYVPIGDVRGSNPQEEEKTMPDGRSGIFRVTQDGQAVLTIGKGILGDEDPLNKYYAYGIRNSFGIDFDPVTGVLWDTENGRGFGDEVNLVKPGFNSGWSEIQGIWRNDGSYSEPGDIVLEREIEEGSYDYHLVNFDGKAKYSEPEFTWYTSVAPTSLKFLDSDKYGKQYENDMFVGDFNNGNIYHFDLNKERTKLILDGTLEDTVANTPDELQHIIFAQGFGRITDMEVGPDGYLYILSLYEGNGAIFRIIPTS